jgi:multimeric flavodoxin WrbA
MQKNILIINGSLRTKGNTDTLVDHLINGISRIDVAVTKYILRDKEVNGCKGCYYCSKNISCSIQDDMQKIHHEIQKSDLLIFASPMYWWGFTGLMKTFIDRLYLYYPKSNAHLVKGKKLVLIIPMNVNKSQHGKEVYLSEIEPLQMTTKYIFGRLGIEIIDIKFFPGLSKKDDAKNNENYLNCIHKLGENLSMTM